MKILDKSKNLNMNKTEISLNISLIRYYVVFLVSLLTALGIGRLMRFCRLLHCHHVNWTWSLRVAQIENTMQLQYEA